MVLRKRDAFESDLDETYSASGYRDKKYFLDNLCFSGTAFCHDICKHSAWFLPYEVGKHEFRFICVFAKDKEKKMDLRENKYSFFGLQLWIYIFETAFLLLIVLACFVQLIDNEPFREVYAFQFQLFQLIFSVLIFFLYYIYIIYIYLIIN